MRTHSNTISEVFDEKLANAFALATVAQANVRSTTMRGVGAARSGRGGALTKAIVKIEV